jgi:hypothetical protein
VQDNLRNLVSDAEGFTKRKEEHMCSSTSNHYHSNCCCCNHHCCTHDSPTSIKFPRATFPFEVLPNLDAEQKLEAILALVPERTNRPNNGIDDADYWTFKSAALELLFRAPASMLDVDTIEKLFSVLTKEDAWMVFMTSPLDRQHLMVTAIQRSRSVRPS